MSKHASDFAGLPVETSDENALLRAALAEAQRRIAELEQRSESDSLTPLPTAFRFRSELERVVGLAERHGTSAAVVGIELTNLATVNERHGHFAVDAALVHVARLLCGLIRSTDILARTGDNRFDLILDHLDHNSAIDTGDRLARCIEDNPLDLGHAKVKLESAVATTGIMPGDKLDEVLARAERNLALAKSGE
ncbi:MAG TPA: GGDEF domain-containing protein [Allosphingosinicella sp.]|jgi:diguanylate cyclase (GGDEF)-like protein|nr:GGDEF domain-containing protein [Allosphingosinicella sp.]